MITSGWARLHQWPFNSLTPILLIGLGLVACRQNSASEVQVTNGVLDLADGAVVMLVGTNANGNRPKCTASLIRADLLLTAAHCIKDASTGEIRKIAVAGSQPIVMVEYRIHPRYEMKAAFDVALIKINSRLPNVPPLTLSSERPKVGDQVKLVGFGGNQYAADPLSGRLTASGSGVRRAGTTQIIDLGDRFIYTRGILTAIAAGKMQPSGEGSALGAGDSGGPMLDSHGAIIGIAAEVNTHHTGETAVPTVLSAHTSVADVMDFLTQASAELK